LLIFFISRVPDPLIILGQKYDFFDIRGFKEISEEVLYFYKLFNSEENFSFFIGTNPHGYYTDAQKEMVSFFCKIAKREIINLEPEIEIEKVKICLQLKKGMLYWKGQSHII
jgi:16S rRNA G527 N7-methylase RsmG